MTRIHPRTAVTIGLVAAILAAAVIGLVAVTTTDIDDADPDASGPSLTERWVSDTARNISGNHHVPAADRVEGTGMVYAPISGAAHRHENGSAAPHSHEDSGGCALVALYAANGSTRWADRVPPSNCTIHAVSDPTLSDLTGDGRPHVVAATTERVVKGFDPETGEVAFSHGLSAYGYTRPVAADVAGDDDPELVAVDVRGSAFVVTPGGGTVWERRHEAFTWGQPAVADFDADGDPELVVAHGDGTVVMYAGADGRVEWRRTLPADDAITWAAAVPRAGDGTRDVVVATTEGRVRLIDGRSGEETWHRDVGELAAVHAVADGDGDGTVEIYATGGDGIVRSLAAPSGRVEWTTNVTTASTQMMPPATLGDLDGDGRPELVAPTNNGRVAVLAPDSGAIRATYRRDRPIWTRAAVADLDGTGGQEVVVMYGNGRVAVLSYDGGDAG